jgi:hypothetical protein
MSFQAIFKNTRLWTFVCGLFLFSSCRYSKTPEVFEDKNISIEYPSYLFKAEDVYPGKNTILQLKNDYRDVYFILVDHGMKPGVQGFELMCDSVINQLKRNLKEPNVEAKDTLFTTANNFKVKEFQISGILSSEKQDHRFYFVVDVMEGPNGHIYQTAGWLLRHKRDLWLKDLQKSAYSLKVK